MSALQDRIGGRIHTFKSGHYVADLGAMVITGLGEHLPALHLRRDRLIITLSHDLCRRQPAGGAQETARAENVQDSEALPTLLHHWYAVLCCQGRCLAPPRGQGLTELCTLQGRWWRGRGTRRWSWSSTDCWTLSHTLHTTSMWTSWGGNPSH